ncbi:envelope integrity protein Cei [Mycolicibacterium rufum]|uniref:Envelope integrity protein Cei n=1 Tax=Mycolicibacterium rufum TaxID=318424 RepID=A0A9X3BT61_9MYCO|nr:envelope integrity protein Cei [Mycolicibacterium rufum]KGI67916.1 secreted alanine rich protein [Mycolicibacterium rufum]MCV7073031.1 envelope integrity protein Cei [Mycolicibacterium rufum]ULP38900.1 envelope integrity protein Cei [Mycolicibacterium rufum]
MVAQITEGTAFDKHGRPFRRRNFVPGALMFAALAVAALLVWVIALSQPPDVREVAVCNPPPAPTDPNAPVPDLGEQVSRSNMTDVTPAKLADTRIRVLNASGQGGQAGEVAGALRDLGFTDPEAANDPVYASTRLQCQGQIRFGPAGRAAAASLWLVAPCTELFQDQRTDDTVDLAIGTDFTELAHSDDIDAVLASLMPDATQPADPSLLSKIHTQTC